MLVAEPALDRVINQAGLEREDFYLDRHRHIFDAIVQLFSGGKPVDELSVTQKLKEMALLEEAGGPHYVSELAAKVPAAGNAKHYADIVRSEAQLRRLIGAGQEMQRLGGRPEPRPRRGDGEGRGGGPRHRSSTAARGRATSCPGLNEVIDRQERLSSGEGEISGVETGFVDLDQILRSPAPRERHDQSPPGLRWGSPRWPRTSPRTWRSTRARRS